MAYVNFKNSPSEETPLTGGATGNLNIMQENGTSHGADTKLGYTQSFLNEHIINVSNEVDEDYKVNFIKGKNLFDKVNVLNAYINAGTAQLASDGSFRTVYIKVKPNTTYTIQKILSNRFVLGFSSDTDLTLPKQLNSVWQDNSATQKTITSTSTANYLFICVSKTSEDTVALEDILNSIQVEEGDTATSYESYTRSIYIDNEEIYSKEDTDIVDITGELTFATGWSISDGALYKQGKHIFGTIQIKPPTTLSAGSNNQNVVMIPYTLQKVYIFGGFSTAGDRWGPSNGTVYIYLSSIGSITLAPSAQASYIRCQIDVVEA